MPSRTIINGTLQTFSPPNGIRVHFDPTRGTTVEQDFVCAGDNLAGWATLLFRENVAFDWVRSPVKSTMRITYSGGVNGIADTAQTNWQVLGNEIQYSVLESSMAKSLQDIAPPVHTDGEKFVGAIQALRTAADAIRQNDQSTADDLRDFIPDAGLELWDELLDLLTCGQTNFARGQYVLKRTYSISNFYTGLLPGEDLCESIILTSAILLLGMPPVVAAKINSIPVGLTDDSYLWGWRQLPSTMTTTANNRVEVSTEWWLASWRRSLYP